MKLNFTTLIICQIGITFADKCNLAEVCTDGNLLKIVDSQNSKECLTYCQKLENCGFFTFLNDSTFANCQLYENCYETSSCENCISGEVNCPNFSCQLPGLCFVSLNVSNYVHKIHYIYECTC